MRYLTVYEYDSEDQEKVRKAYSEGTTIREKNPDKLPKVLLDTQDILGELPKLTKSMKILMIYETDDPNQLGEVVTFWKDRMPEINSFRMHFVPINDSSVRREMLSPRRASAHEDP